MDNRAIGIFDSGVGGVTVLKELQKLLPNENFAYIGDTASFPYGSKSKKTIIELCKKRIENLIDMEVKMIVIACGTATSQALDEVKSMYNIPIIGIIEPTVNYIKENKKYKDIGIIATRGTIRSNTWEKELKSKIQDIKVYNKECPLLAPMAEEGWTQNEIAKLAIHEYLKEIKNIDALVLGCTHYPLFKKIIKEEVGENVDIINTGEMVAKEVKEYIIKNKMRNNDNENSNTQIYLTDLECNFINVAKKLLQVEDVNIQKIS